MEDLTVDCNMAERMSDMKRLIRRERIERILTAETQLSSKCYLAQKTKIKFWRGALKLDTSWNNYEKGRWYSKEKFMIKTLLMCLQDGGIAETLRATMITFYKGDSNQSLTKVKENRGCDGLYQVLLLIIPVSVLFILGSL